VAFCVSGLLAAGCSGTSEGGAGEGGTQGDDGDTGGPQVTAAEFDAPGPYDVGTVAFEIPARADDPGGRQLWIQIWYPAQASSEPVGLADFETDADRRAAIETLVAAADPDCIRNPTASHLDATPVEDTGGAGWPVVLSSHCHDCVRWGGAYMAERLASHGIAVVAPDHTDNTLFNNLDGTPGSISAAMLDLRAGDMARALDVLVDPSGTALESSAVAGRFDLDRVGMIGHSFGATTLGRVLQDDQRVSAGMAFAAPLVLFPGTEISAIEAPVFIVRALEDNSIGVLGNDQIENQFEALPGPVWMADVADAGHWSFFDIAGLTDDFSAGCGAGERQTAPGENFTYLDNERAREIAASYAARFFAFELLDAPIQAGLGEAVDAAVVEVRTRP